MAHSIPHLHGTELTFSVSWPPPKSVPDTDCIRLLAVCTFFFFSKVLKQSGNCVCSSKPWACLFWEQLTSCQSAAHNALRVHKCKVSYVCVLKQCTNCHSHTGDVNNAPHGGNFGALNVCLHLDSGIKISLWAWTWEPTITFNKFYVYSAVQHRHKASLHKFRCRLKSLKGEGWIYPVFIGCLLQPGR